MNKQKAINQANAAGHVDGNNYLTTKIFRCSVLLFDEPGSSTQFGQYFFPEISELNNKNIVGISINVGGPVPEENFYYNSPLYDRTQFVQGQPYVIASKNILQLFYLNLYNEKKLLVVENFPCLQLADWNSNWGSPNKTPKYGQKKIYPIHTKLNIRECFIFGNASGIASNVAISLNFFYN